MQLIKQLHAAEPDVFTTPALANQFKISSEAVRRILKSRFEKVVKTKRKEGKLNEKPKMDQLLDEKEREELLRRWEEKDGELVSEEEVTSNTLDFRRQ